MRLLLLIILSLFIIENNIAGNKSGLTKNQEKRYFRKTMKLIYKGHHKHAKSNLLELLELDSNNIHYNYELALLYYYDLNETDKALPYLEAVDRLKQEGTYLEIHYYLGQAYHFTGQYDKAISEYNIFKQYIHEKDLELQKEVAKYITECNNAKKLEKNNKTRIRNLGNRINTSFPEYVPVPINNDSILLFTSKRPYIMSDNFGFEGKERYEKVYISRKKGSSYTFAEKSSIFPEFQMLEQSKHWHNAIVSNSHDGNTLMIYKKNRLWTSVKKDGIWQEPVKVSKIINFSFYQPHASITADGKTIFFSSWSKKKGFGNLDIYCSKKQENGTWGQAINLGSKINTQYNEDSPEISPDGKTLYFSSKGHNGAGGYDIYKSTLINDKWTTPQNMGFPINSTGDDIFFKFNSKGDLAYFSSYRKGGFGDMDIYVAIFGPQFDNCTPFVDKPSENKFIGFEIQDSVLIGESFKINAEITKAEDYTFTKYFWKIDDKLIIDSTNFNYTFDCTGNYNIKMEVEAVNKETKESTAFCVSKNVKVVAEEMILADNNSNTENNSISDEDNNSDSLINNTGYGTASLKLNNIYFDFDKFNIRESEIHTLNKNIDILKQYSDSKIKIVAHTDSRGPAAYNQILSEKRAKSVYNYIIDNGIDKNRIIEVTGKGESNLVNNCKDKIVCSKAEHQLNRRTELIIVY